MQRMKCKKIVHIVKCLNFKIFIAKGIATLGVHPRPQSSSSSTDQFSHLSSVSDMEISLDFNQEDSEKVGLFWLSIHVLSKLLKTKSALCLFEKSPQLKLFTSIQIF